MARAPTLLALSLLIVAPPAAAVRTLVGIARNELAEHGARFANVAAVVGKVPANLPLCDPRVVEETCALLRGGAADAQAVGVGDVQDTLSARASSAGKLWEALGLSPADTVDCAELCKKLVERIGEFATLPPSSDTGCYTQGNTTVCNVGLDPLKVLQDARFSGDLPDFHDKQPTPARRGLPLAGVGDDDGEEGLAYSERAMMLRTANLFRIYPAASVAVSGGAAANGSSLAQAAAMPCLRETGEGCESDGDCAQRPGATCSSGACACPYGQCAVSGQCVSQAEADAVNPDEVIQAANLKSRTYVQTALRMVRLNQGSSTMQKWFGSASAASSDTRTEILRVLNSIDLLLSNVVFVYPGPRCSAQTYAYVHPRAYKCDDSELSAYPCTKNQNDQFVFYMCTLTLTRPPSEHIETMTHEGSHHATAYTDDVCADDLYRHYGIDVPEDGSSCHYGAYGRDTCRALASYAPDEALQNADNFCYYIQDLTDA